MTHKKLIAYLYSKWVSAEAIEAVEALNRRAQSVERERDHLRGLVEGAKQMSADDQARIRELEREVRRLVEESPA